MNTYIPSIASGLELLVVLVLCVNYCYASFPVTHDLYSTPEFIVRNDSRNYLLENQVHSYIQSVKHLTSLEVEIMKFHNETYACTIPVLNETDLATDELRELAEWNESELLQAEELAVKGLMPLSKQCIYYRKDWWTYSFCYGKDIRQFHMDESFAANNQPPDPGPGIMSFILGKFDHRPNGELKYDVKVKHSGYANYLAYNLGLGTVCDLTGKDRSIEIQFYCFPSQAQDSVMWIKEVSSCKYQIGIRTSKICDVPVFAPLEKVEPHKIECQRILSFSDVESWEKRRKLSMSDKVETQVKPETINEKPVEKSIEKPLVVKDPKQQVMEVIYNDNDFSNSEAMLQIRLPTTKFIMKGYTSYLEDLDESQVLLFEKFSELIRGGKLKKANGKHIGVKDQFKTVIQLLDIDGVHTLDVRVELGEGELYIGIIIPDDKDSDSLIDSDSEDNINEPEFEQPLLVPNPTGAIAADFLKSTDTDKNVLPTTSINDRDVVSSEATSDPSQASSGLTEFTTETTTVPSTQASTEATTETSLDLSNNDFQLTLSSTVTMYTTVTQEDQFVTLPEKNQEPELQQPLVPPSQDNDEALHDEL